ncbi:MAG TPA: hypothetical protein VFX91_12190 [Alcanivorax sp.]|nr:hypothetical protein [Alcanivorax sp.]
MAWKLIDHVCQHCLGRILHDGTTYRCSNCGATEGADLAALCCCGAKLKTGKNAGLRCTRNHHQTPDCPGEIVVTYGN